MRRARIVAAIALLLAACGAPPIKPVVNVMCAQPAADTLARSQPLPQAPQLSNEPDVAINQLDNTLALDADAYKRLSDRHESLIDFGVMQCGWTR